MTGKIRVLYISYDGMLEPLGQSQVLAYLEGLGDDYEFDLVSFEKPADWKDEAKRSALEKRLKTAGIHWHPLTYHKSPSVPATLYDIWQGMIAALWIARKRKPAIVHARSYLPAMMAREVKRFTGAKFLFDIRGLWADERTDGGLWPENGRVYRTVKAIEKQLFLAADASITLTNSSVELIRDFDYLKGRDFDLHMIPTCANLELFKPQPGIKPEGYTLGYVGSVGTWYLFDEVLKCFDAIRRRRDDAQLLIVNRKEQDYIRERLAAHGVDDKRVTITSSEHRDVPKYIAQMSVGAAIIKPAYSKIASAPTKLAEYLGCGVPCLGNDGVGDMNEILEGEQVGVSLPDFTVAAREEGIDRLMRLHDDPELQARCRKVAEDRFSLSAGVQAYRRIYQGLLATPSS